MKKTFKVLAIIFFPISLLAIVMYIIAMTISDAYDCIIG
jgi:phage shock protein PspC (stress-responsive transcriptional regulator)